MKLKSKVQNLKIQGGKLYVLWQTKDPNYAYTCSAGMIFLALSVICGVLRIIVKSGEESILTIFLAYAFFYLAIFSTSLAVLCMWVGFYVNNSCKPRKYTQRVSFDVLLVLIGITIITSVPFIIVLAICGWGMKRSGVWDLDVTLYGMLFVCALIAILSILMYWPNSPFAVYLLQRFMRLPFIKDLSINIDAAGYFTMITLLLIESHLIALPISKGIAHFYKASESESYMKIYTKNCVTKARIGILITLFAMATFIKGPELHSGDMINVLTIYTLGLLYFDKSREGAQKLQKVEEKVK